MSKTHKSRKLDRRRDDNIPVPDGLTETFIEMINALPSSVKTDYLKAQYLTKFVSDDTDPPAVRRDRAIEKWIATEGRNYETNLRILHTVEEYNILPGVTFEMFCDYCRGLIREVIGDTAPDRVLIGTFSGGASTSRNRIESHPAGKYLGKSHATQPALELFNSFWGEEMPLWYAEKDAVDLSTVSGNELFTVPKKTDIDRVACKEPDINMFVQKGIGSFFRERLKMYRINLNDQSINRKLARLGSMTGHLSTLDLSSASDSVTTCLVAEMLPVCWYTLLDSVRSPVTVINGEEHVNEMFSSMGNGFTFELESLLFFAITRAVVHFGNHRGVVSIYGDDIICPTPCVQDLIYVLSYLGFETNVSKSHFTGTFRESCGGHYDRGYNVTPFYLRAPMKRLTDVIHIANSLRQWARYGDTEEIWTSILNPEVEHIWIFLSSYVPKALWGGVDLSYKYQLVSYGDVADCRLVPERVREDTGLGGYLHWHNATWERDKTSDGVQTSSRSKESSKMRLRRVPPPKRTVARLHHAFYHEVVSHRVCIEGNLVQ